MTGPMTTIRGAVRQGTKGVPMKDRVLEWTRRCVPRTIRKWIVACVRQPRLAAEIGLGGILDLMVRTRTNTRGTLCRIAPRGSNHGLAYRVGASDLDVFHQVFVDREYAPLDDLSDVRLVVDCGANVGYSSAYFLSRFPSCRVIAVEPDPGNFAILEGNLRPFGDRARVVRAGVWSRNVPLKIRRERYRDGREWSIQVRPAEANEEPDLVGRSIGSLLESSGADRISLLKMDIEGAEVVVFGSDLDWLDRVDAIAIELHDDSPFGAAGDVFRRALAGRGFDTVRRGELTICRRGAVAERAASRL